MSPSIHTSDILLRLGLTLLFGALYGVNRGERGRAAGLRTTLLVCLAAAIAMILANLLLETRGKAANSFVNIDPMRLPLGVLSGMGFLGAAAVIRKEGLVLGVTTAATLWFVTVMGLAFGSGQLFLGVSAAVIGLVVLLILKSLELYATRQMEATIAIQMDAEGPAVHQIAAKLRDHSIHFHPHRVCYIQETRRFEIEGEIRWKGRAAQLSPPDAVLELARSNGVLSLEWKLA